MSALLDKGCRVCGVALTPTSAVRSRAARDGFLQCCLRCHAAEERRRYWRDPDKSRQRLRDRRARFRKART